MHADTKNRRVKIRLWSVIFWLLLWQLASMALNQQMILVSPAAVLMRLGDLVFTPDFWLSVRNTLMRIALGFLLGVTAGTVLAFLSARFGRIQELLAPLILAIRAVPVASFIILALILFSSENLAVLISFLMVLPVFYENVLVGIHARDPQMQEMARIFRLSPARRIRYVDVPQLFPYFASASHAGIGMSWKSGVAAEVIGMPTGSIGEKLQQAKVYFDTPDLFAWTLVIVLLSLLFEQVFGLLLNRIRKWAVNMP